MSEFILVLLKIAAMFLVMAVGWFARRREWVTAETTGCFSRLLVDLVFPALVFTQMLKTMNPAVVRAGWLLPLLGAALIAAAHAAGLLLLPLVRRREKLPTVLFLAGIPNWIYLPLPIIAGLFGDAGVRDLILCNVGCQAALWSLGIWTLRGGRFDRQSLKELAANPGLVATLGGMLLALTCPAARRLAMEPAVSGAPALAAAAVLQALEMLGSLTIPLSLLVTGIQLGNLNLLASCRPAREFLGVLAVRLLAAPALFIALLWLAGRAGLTLEEGPRLTLYLIACMPVAVSCSILTERFGGDTFLAAQSIFYSTLLSIASVPAWFYLLRLWNL